MAEDRSSRRKIGGLGPFAIMSLSYILFTTTDGGVRIIVLLHAYKQGFTALALAAIFSGYELAGMIVNLLAGMAGVLYILMELRATRRGVKLVFAVQ